MRSAVIFGAGPVGLTLANRLAEDMEVTVLVPLDPISFISSSDAEFVLNENSNSGTIFGNSTIWGSQHESLDMRTSSVPAFSDLPGFPFDLRDLFLFDSELINQGWPNFNPGPAVSEKNRFFRNSFLSSSRRTGIWKSKNVSPLPKEISAKVKILQKEFRAISFNFASDLSLTSVDLDGVKHEADIFVFALGGLSNVAYLQIATEELHSMGVPGLELLGKGYSNHPKAKVFEINFRKYMKLVQFNRSEKYQLLANFEINDDPSLQRGIRISARFWPAHSGRGRARHLLSRIMGKFGYFRAADVVVYMELPQLSHNSVKLIKKDSREFTFSFNYNFPPALKSHISEQIEILRNLLANDDDVNEIVALPLNIEDVLKMDSNHHFAGTRMADNQAGGIVDSKGRTFFSHNLFVVGTSTLPVSSNLHPTFLCAALSLRTASEILRT